VRALRIARAEAGMTLEELGAASGVAFSTISKIERGVTKPQAATLHKLAQALRVNVADLLGEEERPKVLRPRTLDELLQRAGISTRWLTLPDEEFKGWWLGVSREEASRRFWQEIHAEYLVVVEEFEAGGATVAPEMQKKLLDIRMAAFERHFFAIAAGPGSDEPEEEFYERQRHQALRQFTLVEAEKPHEETVARAS